MSQTELESQQGGVAGTGAPQPQPPRAATTEREYLILESTQDGVWREKEKITADSNDAALAAIKDPNKAARYQPIATRNWSPKSPKIETVTTVNWE